MAATSLAKLHDDILISIISWIVPSDIISLGKVSIARDHLSFHDYFANSQGYPFPNVSFDSLSIRELERTTRNAYRLGRRWCSKKFQPRFMAFYDGLFSTSITDVRFVPGHGNRWIVTISKSVWSVLALWDVSGLGRRLTQAHKSGEWSPKGGIFKSFCLNTDPTSIATLAIGLLHEGNEMMYILSIRKEKGTVSFDIVTSFSTNFTPVTLQGDVIALSDERSQISIWNWRTNKHATLRYPQQEGDPLQHNTCHQILICSSLNSILVVRNQSISLFPYPELKATNESISAYTPIAQHHFGWIDGITATLVQSMPTGHRVMPCDEPIQTISLLLRRKNADPWYSDAHSIEHYILLPNPIYDPLAAPPALQEPTEKRQAETKPPHHLPYIFPPFLRSHIPGLRGSLGRLLNSSNIILGRNGTAIWINPQDYAAGGLYFGDDDSPLQIIPYVERLNERLMAAIFHGPMSRFRAGAKAQGMSMGAGMGMVGGDVHRVDKWTICVNDRNNWTAMDYDEDTGRIAIGSASGDLTLFVL